MEKTRFGRLTSILLVLVFILAPLRVMRADQEVSVRLEKRGDSYDIYVKNSSDRELTGWTVTITIPEGATYSGCWNCKETINGNTVKLSNEYDWQIPAPGSGEQNVAGFNMYGDFDSSAISVIISPKFASAPTQTPTPDPKKDTPTPEPKKDTPTPEPKKDTPTPVPTETPTAVPTAEPTEAPTEAPTAEPTAVPGTIETTVTPAESSESSESTEASETTEEPGAGTTDPVSGDDWLTTDGNKIVDSNGTQVWLTGVNWFGYNTGTNIFDGCWSCNMDQALKAIADHGFNLLRIPMSAELALSWKNGIYPDANFNQATNSELVGMNSLEIFDYALSLCQKYGIKVMLDIHSANTDASGHMTNLWYTDKISIEDYYDALSYLADRYKNNDTVIAYDLKNEPHGKPNEEKAIWNDSVSDNNWKYVAEEAGRRVLDANPHALIVIEGIEIYPKDLASNGDFSSTNDDDYYFNWWGGNLRGVKDYPIDLGSEERNKQIVYSPHDYGPAVYAQKWFEGDYTYESLKADCWNENWLYIYNENTAPILIGEWGGFMTEPNLTWMTYLRQLIGEYHLNYTFWCFNANSGDTGGLVLDDFTTWDEEKYTFVKEVLWQDDDKFVGLDHAVPLGSNGISLSEYSGEIVSVVPEVPETTAPAPTENTAAPSEEAVPSETDAAVVTQAPATTVAAKESVSVGKIILYVVLLLLLLFLCICAYLYAKHPKTWNRLIDRFYLPEKLKHDIPWELEPNAEPTGRFAWQEETPKNNEFAGKFRPVSKEAVPSEEAAKTASKQVSKPASKPASKPTSNPASSQAAAAGILAASSTESRKEEPAEVEETPDAKNEKVIDDPSIPAIVRDFMQAETPAEEEAPKIVPTWASGSDIPSDRPIWAKPAKVEEIPDEDLPGTDGSDLPDRQEDTDGEE